MNTKYKITQKLLEDEDISIDRVEHLLLDIADGIKKSNKLNLTDINIICEDIFGEILNKTLEVKMVSTSANMSGNCPAVDLIDINKGIAFQVTSRKDNNKVREMCNKFQNAEFKGKIKSINMLIIGQETFRKHEPIDLGDGVIFDYEENVYDINRLVQLIAKKGDDFVAEIYQIIRMVFDSGRLRYENIIQKTEEFLKESYEEWECFGKRRWVCGTGDVSLKAFIPISYGEKLTCILEFRQANLSGLICHYSEERVKELFFVDKDSFVRRTSQGRQEWEDEDGYNLGECSVRLNPNTCEHVYLLFQKLEQKYEDEQLAIASKMGADNYKRRMGDNEKREHDSYILFESVPWGIWIQLINFLNGKSRTNDFWNRNMDGVYVEENQGEEIRFVRNGSFELLATIKAYESKSWSHCVDICWLPETEIYHIPINYDNIEKWRADYTHDWITHHLWPYVNYR